ncbi:E3 ubiquitin-protein ligase HUWE1-like isoform X13 [Salvelinus fontinalis]|uniref:E3 ubiquitin-protein ligase HUWE1-like isoform X13 n=1 Tax=Salvelinus fontinalis TaxID=8038 RepID=UPI002485699D|nr:E3 ubiquitin-protein ligase HUWE1-like isoform X13 [Salvelinus fontinalis]
MKVDRSKLKKTPTEAPADCRTLIEKLKGCRDEQLLLELQHIKTWNIGKCELYHWVDLLDRFDGILCDAGQTVENMSWLLVCDRPDNGQLKALLLAVLNFTALLIEYSFSRHLYSSIEHLTTLLASCDMQVVLSVLNLLYVFSKRSNYITRLGSDKRTPLLARLQHLAESWGGKENGFGLAECCRDLPMTKYPPSATTLHFEFYAEPGPEVKVERKTSSNTLHYIHIEQLDKISESPSEIMESLTVMYNIPKDKQTLLFTHIRLAHGFSNHKKRLQAVQARLHAISILVYSNALQESANSILYNGLIEELVDVLQITDKQLVDIKAASLRTLTSIVHLERTPKLSNIIDCTGTASYHGFLPVLVRNCIQAMIDPLMEPYPHQFATALFSFLYHLASYDAGGEALVSCGMMEALLKVIKFLGDEQDQITFVTRAVRVVDLITNLDMAAFQSHTGLTIFISRLEHEVDLSRKECPFVIKPKIQRPNSTVESEDMDTDVDGQSESLSEERMESSPGPSTSSGSRPETDHRAQSSTASTPRTGLQCIPQRAALLKSMLNFLKKAIQDPAFSDGIRHVMDGSLPTSLKHIISNAEYYGPSLFLLATEVVTVFVFQEPSLLSSLQDNGLTDVMLHALLIKDSLSLQVPATREVLGSLPNVFSALCLNARGLHSFVQCQPFERLFKVLLSPDYLPAMRRRRSSDPLGDTASNLGSAVDELMRHQPTLKTDATTAIIKLLEEICNLGRAPEYICQKPSIQKTDGTVTAPPARSSHAAEEASSEDEEEEEALHTFTQQQGEPESNRQSVPVELVVGTEERIPIPLMDYILNVMKFVESILSNNTTDDHCQEFVNQKGLLPLVSILGLPNLPIDFPTSAACQAVAGVCKSILTLSHEPKVLQEGLCQLDSILSALEPLHRPIEVPGGSVLLRELATAGHVTDATLSARATPLLHALTAAHAYILMFVHTCRVGQSEIRAISVNQWGSQLGLSVLNKLSQLYCSLVWESTVLLSLCTPNSLPPGCEFGQADMQKLVPKEEKPSGSTTATASASGSRRTAESEAVAVDPSATCLLEGMGLDGDTLAPMETDEPTAGTSDPKTKSKLTPAMATRIKQIKPLLSASSRLGRALAELFGLLVKLCVGSPVRQRRSHHATSTGTAPTPAARATASSLTKLLTKGLSWQPPPYTPTPRFRLTFFICSVGFTSPMLFDERKYPYHLMLQKFFCSGGHNALFETFNWALSMGGKVPVSEGLEHAELPDGTGEFLDAWLMLVEKMVNPSTVLDSPHSLPVKVPGVTPTTPQFSALRFLIVTQKAAFSCICSLWNRRPLKVYGGRMAESMLAILCHILRGEPVIQERLAKEREGTARPEEEGGLGASTLPVGPSSGVAGGSAGAPGAAVNAGEGPAGSVPGPAIGSSTAPPAPGGAAEDSTNTTPRREPPVNQAQLQQAQGGSRERQPNVNQQQLQQLMDMGFSREHAMEALVNTSTMEQATEYLLTHPPPLLSGAVRDMTMSEEDQMMRAIAMSLGQEVSMEQRSDSPEEAARHREEDDRRARERTEEEEARCLERFLEAEPLDSTELHAFTDSMLPGCFHLLDELPDTVYRLCDLLMTAIKRSGPEYRDLILRQVVNQVWEAADVLIKAAIPLTTSDTKTVSEWTRQMATLPQASNLATRILLLTLLFEELKLSCARVVENSGILNVLIKLLEVVQPCLQAAKEQKDIQTPKWITPVLLIIDFYEKMAVSSKRRAQMNKYLQPNGNNWRWFDDRSGRWCSYSASNNGTIDSAWRAGESSVRFTAGRRRYTVQFNTMVQVNEETGNRRPVMLTVQRVPRVPKPAKTGSMTDSEREEGDKGKAEETQTDPDSAPVAVEMSAPKDDNTTPQLKESFSGPSAPAAPLPAAPLDPTSERTGAGGAIVVQGLTEDMTTVLIRACVSMISVPVDPDTLHATLRLCLRLTRTHHYAMMFAELKSTRMILGLKQGSGFNGFTPLVTLLFRHIIEDPATLRHTMEKVVRSAVTSGAGSTTSGVVSGSLGSREINYILRVLGPAACRNPDCFADTANSCVRIALPAPRGAGTASDDEFENLRIKGPNAVQLVKTTPLKLSPLPPIPDTIKEVIYDMLNALAAYHAPEEAERPEEPAVAVPGGQDLCQILQDDDVYQQYRLTRQGSDFDSQSAFHINAQVFTADGAVADSSQSGTPQGEGEALPPCSSPPASTASTPEEMREEKKEVEGENGASSEEGKGAKAKASKPLMPTSTILRLLAELVRSYVGIATLIASYCYTAGQSELIKEDCSVLAFVLDHLLPHTQSSEDKDTPALARLFLASLAAAGTGTDAQVALVNEVKAALSRALAMAEGTEKHARLQAVMCIISTIMESCPSTSSFYSTAAAKTQHNGMNNIIRLFLKKGLVNDLARVPHSLDLSSPNMANTVNAALKPLETLSRIVNQPSSLFGGKGGSSKNKAEHDTVGAARDSNINTQGTTGDSVEGTLVEGSHRVQGTDGDLMDGETEGDTVVIAGQPEVLSTTAMQVENELVDLIDELLERDAGAVNSSIIVGRGSGEDESQEDVLMDEAPSNISQASTLQTNREDSMNILEPEDEEHTQEEDSSGSNDDEDSQDEEEEEEEEEEEDQDDEEGDEDDDDEGSEMELDEDFPDINAAPHIRFERFDRDDDLIIEFDNMFSTTADIPPSPGNIPSSHPLMVRHADHGSLTLGGAGTNNRLAQGMGRSQRTLRQLTANTGHTIHVHYPGNRQPNPPLILQRLLGPSAAADILQLSSSLPLQSRGRARLLVGNEDVHIIARSDDELLDDFFHEQSSTGGQAGTLSSIPTALTRWTDECKVLDAESMHDCVAVVKVPILQHLETLRDEELEERREKRRRQLAEEEEAKQNDRRTGGEEAREQSLQGSGLGTVNGAAGETTAEGEPQGSGVSCLDPPRVSEGFLTAPPSGEVTPTTPAPHEQALVSLETAISQQVHQPIADLLLAESHANSLATLAGAGLPDLTASSDRLNCEAEASQMEMSPAPPIASLSPDIVETSEPAAVGVSQLEGSPMDTSSPVSATQEEPNPAQAVHLSQELSGSGDSGVTDTHTDAETGSTTVSTPGETMPLSDCANSQSQAIQEEPLPSTSNEDEDPLAGISLPEGVDPSFLAALPEDIRREVLQNQLGIRPPARPPASSTLPSTTTPVLGGGPGVTEVSPEFLAALPPAIQEEVLAQQRAEQQRRELSQQPTQGDTPLDPVTFIQTLPSELRRSVLEDMEDSVLAVMPPDIAAEAAALRREQEVSARQRQLMHERLFGHSSSSALSAILRSPAFTSRLGGNRGVQYTRLAVQRGGTFQMGGGANHSRPSSSSVDSLLRLRGRLLLDHEALSCLLVLLFVDEPKLNTSRLHRVLRNLCYHSQTRGWVIRSLLSILQRSSESEVCVETTRLEDARGKRTAGGQGGYGASKGSTTTATAASSLSSSSSSSLELINRVESRSSSQLSWLSVSMDAALGCRTNIFQIQRASGRKHADRHSAGGTSGGPGGTLGGGVQGVTAGVTCPGGGGSTVHIHPQAAPVVCRHVLDTLIQLAKVFPSHFTQQRCKDLLSSSSTSDLDSRLCAAASIVTGTAGGGSRSTQTNTCSTPSSAQNSLGGGACGTAITPQSLGISTDFWDLLVKLDNMNVSRKGKASMKTVPLGAGGEAEGAQYSLEASPLGQLMNMLSHPVIRRSSLLTEKLLRLLSLISIALPDNKATEVPAGHQTPQSTTAGAGNPATATSTAATAGALGSVSASAQGTTVGVVVPAQGSSSTAIVSIPTSTGASATGKHRATVLCIESDTKLASTGLTEKQLQLSVEVLTSHSCSEEGLEDAANILLQLSRGDGTTRDTVLRLLLSGARHLGYTLCKQIGTLLAELREYNLEQQRRARADAQSPDAPAEDTSISARLKAGKLSSRRGRRFDGSESVVIVAAQKRPLGGRELQLPCMSSLTSKTSTQKFFLRVLQVIIQLREDTRRANKKAKQTGRLGSTSLGSASSIQAAVRQLEAEADAIIQMSEVGSVSEPQAVQRDDSPMDVDQPSPLEQDPAPLDEEGNSQSETEERLPDLPLLSEQLLLDELWDMLGECLKELEESHDQHAVLVLQPAVEAFFLVHATERESKPPVRDTRESQLSHIKDEPPPLSPAPLTPATPSSLDPFFSREPSSMHISSNLPPDTQKFLRFAETHRTVLNQILRQSTTHLADGPFAVLVDYIRILDFDVKRKYFRQELERLDEGLRKEDMAVHVRRDHVFEDSYRELHRKSPEDMKNRLYIVFEGEEGQDAGGLLREWYMIISREMFNAMYALFRTSPGDRVTYTINPSSHCNPNHLSYFKFVGRVVAKAVYDNRLLECYFTRSFYKHILGKSVRYTDMESEDYPFFQGLVYLLENNVSTLGYELTFSTEVQEFGVCEVRDLKPNGGNIIVTEENKKEYVHLVCQMKMTGAIRKQLSAYLEGFYEIIPKRLISIFTEQELELLISGLPTIDIDDLKANTEYHKYQSSSIQIQWFWRALRSFDQADRAKFLQFVTGTSKVPLQGFAALEGMNGIQKFQIHRDDRSTDRLPSAHTCFNQLDLPAYESYEKLRHMLLLAIQECSEGFGLA